MIKFQKPEELAQWLMANQIDISNWGEGESKSLENLWEEYISGESSFEEDPVKRVVEVVHVIISQNQRILLEAAQEFVDGRRRERNRPPADKIKPGEDIFAAALRCLKEELGLPAEQVRIDRRSYYKKEHLLDSGSYPGLPCHYTIHRVNAAVNGLPQNGQFWVDNSAAGEGDPILRHLWQWVPNEPVPNS